MNVAVLTLIRVTTHLKQPYQLLRLDFGIAVPNLNLKNSFATNSVVYTPAACAPTFMLPGLLIVEIQYTYYIHSISGPCCNTSPRPPSITKIFAHKYG